MRLCFDECCSTKLAKELKAFYASDYPDLTVRHVLQDYPRGTADSVWLSDLANRGDWIVISSDSGKNSKKEKLPLICSQFGLTHVLITPTLINGGYTMQKAALVAIWYKLPDLLHLPKGTSVRLGKISAASGGMAFELRVGGKSLGAYLKQHGLLNP